MDWQLFGSTFILIFIAELPDKTAFASLFLATRHDPWAVFIGAAGAFLVQSLVAVTFGSFIALLPGHWVHAGAGLLFLSFAVLMWRRKEEEEMESQVEEQVHFEESVQNAKAKTKFRQSIAASFIVIFIAEWGDLTQLATATLQAKYKAPITLFISATLALWSVTAIGVLVGHRAKKVINPAILQKLAATVFLGVGIFLLLRALGNRP